MIAGTLGGKTNAGAMPGTYVKEANIRGGARHVGIESQWQRRRQAHRVGGTKTGAMSGTPGIKIKAESVSDTLKEGNGNNLAVTKSSIFLKFNMLELF